MSHWHTLSVPTLTDVLHTTGYYSNRIIMVAPLVPVSMKHNDASCMYVSRQQVCVFICSVCICVFWCMIQCVFKFYCEYDIVCMRVCIHGLNCFSPSLQTYLQMKSLPFVPLLSIPSPIPPSILPPHSPFCTTHVTTFWCSLAGGAKTLSHPSNRHCPTVHINISKRCMLMNQNCVCMPGRINPLPYLCFETVIVYCFFFLPSSCCDQQSISLHFFFSHSQFTCMWLQCWSRKHGYNTGT